MSTDALRDATRRRLVLFSSNALSAMLKCADELTAPELEVIHSVTNLCMMNFGMGGHVSAKELERYLNYAFAGARVSRAYVDADHYNIVLRDLMIRCEKRGFMDSSELLEPDSQHALVLNGMIIEDAIVNYFFEEPRFFEYLGEHAEALLPHAQMLVGEASAGRHRVWLSKIEVLLAGGSPTLLEGVL